MTLQKSVCRTCGSTFLVVEWLEYRTRRYCSYECTPEAREDAKRKAEEAAARKKKRGGDE